jgi:hypothetical protein
MALSLHIEGAANLHYFKKVIKYLNNDIWVWTRLSVRLVTEIQPESDDK